MDVLGLIDDGVFEPGEQIVLHNVTILNDGGLTLPSGAFLKIQPTASFKPIDEYIPIPPIRPGETIRLNDIFGTIVEDYNLVRSEQYRTDCVVSVHAELLYRHFEDSFFTKTIPVFYPLQISKVRICYREEFIFYLTQ